MELIVEDRGELVDVFRVFCVANASIERNKEAKKTPNTNTQTLRCWHRLYFWLNVQPEPVKHFKTKTSFAFWDKKGFFFRAYMAVRQRAGFQSLAFESHLTSQFERNKNNLKDPQKYNKQYPQICISTKNNLQSCPRLNTDDATLWMQHSYMCLRAENCQVHDTLDCVDGSCGALLYCNVLLFACKMCTTKYL